MPVRDATPVIILDPIEQTLRGLVRTGCHLFKQGTTPKAAELLLAVLDFKKAAYKQTEEEPKDVKEAKPSEIIIEENLLSRTEEAIISDTFAIKIPPPLGVGVGGAGAGSLPPIK